MGLLQRIKRLFYGENMSPLPWKILWIIFFLQLFLAMKMTMVFSFLPKMVKSFGISEVDTGLYAGMLASVIYIGFLVFSLLWGYLGDTKGKKLSILISLVGLAGTSLFFGFSCNYYWALVTRLLQGCFFGAAVVNKSYLVDHLDDSNMVLGVSIMFTAWTTGFIIGPSMAGLLVFPAEQYPKVFSQDSIFAQFPVLLPHLVSVGGLVIIIIIGMIYLPNDRKMWRVDEKTPLLREEGYRYVPNNRSSSASSSLSSSNETIDGDSGVNLHHPNEKKEEDLKNSTSSEIKKKDKKTNIMRILKNRDCLYTSLVYAWMCCIATANDEMFPLFASTSPTYHGLGFGTSDIGVVLLIASAITMGFQVSIISTLVKRFGPRKSFIYLTLAHSIIYPLIPATVMLHNESLIWVLMCTQTVLIRIFITGEFISINILLNNSVEPNLIGSANGFGFALAAIGRLVAPAMFGSIYSWSLTNVEGVPSNTLPLGFPFNHFLTFFILMLSFILISFMAIKISPSLDFKKVVPAEKNKDQSVPLITKEARV